MVHPVFTSLLSSVDENLDGKLSESSPFGSIRLLGVGCTDRFLWHLLYPREDGQGFALGDSELAVASMLRHKLGHPFPKKSGHFPYDPAALGELQRPRIFVLDADIIGRDGLSHSPGSLFSVLPRAAGPSLEFLCQADRYFMSDCALAFMWMSQVEVFKIIVGIGFCPREIWRPEFGSI